MKHKRRRHDEAISNIRALTTVNGDLSAVAFIVRLAKDKAKEEVGLEFSLIFRSMAQAKTSRRLVRRTPGTALLTFYDFMGRRWKPS